MGKGGKSRRRLSTSRYCSSSSPSQDPKVDHLLQILEVSSDRQEDVAGLFVGAARQGRGLLRSRPLLPSSRRLWACRARTRSGRTRSV